MRNAGLEETQAEMKISGRNINNLRYADDTTLMAEREEELKSFLMKVKVESEKVGLKLKIQKTKIVRLLVNEITNVESHCPSCRRQSTAFTEKSLTMCLVFYLLQLEFPSPQRFLL